MSQSRLLKPFDLAGLLLPNRVVMSPMSRHRALADNLNHPAAATYYAQRASAGLIISEGVQTSPEAKGFPGVPGIFRSEHVADWRRVTDAVHASGGRMFMQLWHCGRVSHRDIQPDQAAPIGPSAILSNATAVLDGGMPVKVDLPQAASVQQIQQLCDEFADAAERAIEAGCDGVELHGANGYLIHQFLSDGSNIRTDRYGGAPQNRIRFALEVVEAVAARIGKARVGIRLSPVSTYQDVSNSDSEALYSLLIEELDRIGIAYLHMVEGFGGQSRDCTGFDFARGRRRFSGAWIVNNMYNQEMAEAALARRDADLVAFGRPYIANPDLVHRFERDAALNLLDQETLYGGDERGYVDYPSLSA